MPDLDEFHDWLHRRGRGRSADQYCRIARRWLDDPEQLEGSMTSRRYSPNYRRHLIACVRVWARYSDDHVLEKRLQGIKRPAAIPSSVREPFELDEWFAIRDAIDEADWMSAPKRLVCGIIALRGIRCGDILRLTRREISQALKTGILGYEAKGERRQQYNAGPMRQYLEELAELEWGDNKHVGGLVCPRGGNLDTAGRMIRQAFDAIADELEMEREDLYAHRFRHTYATYFLQEMAGDPEAIFKLQQQMGWAKLDTAANYLRRSRQGELDEIESRLLSGRKRTNAKT